MIKIPLWEKYCIVLWSLLIIVSLLLSWFLLVERDQWAQPPRALSTGDWWQSFSNHDAPSKWFGGHFGSFLSNYPRRTLWNICAFSHTIFLSLAQPYFLATCLCASFTLFATEYFQTVFFPRRSPGAAKLALAWQTKELPSASPVAFLTAGNLQLLLILVFSVLSFLAFERDAFLVRRRRLWGEIKLWAVCSQMDSWLVNGAGPM